VRKKSQVPRQTQRKPRKRALQTLIKKINVTDNDESRGCDPTTAFPESVTHADAQTPKVKDKPRPGRPGLKNGRDGGCVGGCLPSYSR
jgi:hypothetical protein